MSHFILSVKAVKLRRKLLRYEREKLNSIRIHKGEKAVYTLIDRYRHCCSRAKRFIRRWIFCTAFCDSNTVCGKLFHKFFLHGTVQNYIATTFLGFLGGMILTYILFMLFVFQLHYSARSGTVLCCFIGAFLTLGLAFSYYVRCIVVLVLPQLCVNRGRQALVVYAFILALTGPGKNIFLNISVLTESLACGQEQLKIAAKKVMDAIKKPFLAMKDALTNAMNTIKSITQKIKDTLLSIKRVVMSILQVIKSATSWLASIINICNKELGTPFERCMRVFEPAIADCAATLGPLFSWLCSIVYVGQALCYLFKVLDLICALIDLVKDAVTGPVKKKLRELVWHLRNIFYVSIEYKHSYNFEMEQSKTLREIAAEITSEVKERTGVMFYILHKISFVASLFFFFIIFRAIYYWRKYMTNDRYDNHYITKELYKLDYNRARLDYDTILPLKNREKKKYIQVVSLHLTGSEKVRLIKSVSFTAHMALKILILMGIDYCLFWILDKIREHGRFSSTVQDPQVVNVKVKGGGFLAGVYRNIMGAFKPFHMKTKVDTVSCLPHPLPPNYMRYMQIGFIIMLSFILTIMEPYALRLRQWFMGYYYPQRAQQRAVWLYNHILQSRESFVKFTRRQLRRKFSKQHLPQEHEESFLSQLLKRGSSDNEQHESLEKALNQEEYIRDRELYSEFTDDTVLSRQKFRDVEAQKILDVATTQQFPVSDEESVETATETSKWKVASTSPRRESKKAKRKKVKFSEEVELINSSETDSDR